MQEFSDFFEYHMKTKHSYYSVRNFPNRLDWDNQPSAFKSYPNEFKRIELNLENPEHSFIYYIAGVSAKKTYPGVEYYLRINPSAGALYPNEIYFQSRGNKTLQDGIYHFDIRSSSIILLQEIQDAGLEPYFEKETKENGFIFLISSVYYRSSWKYKNRAFRYCLLDAGHILGTIESSSYLHDKNYKIVYNFDKEKLNKAFSFDDKEFFTAAVLLSSSTKEKVNKQDLSLPTVDGCFVFEKNEMIEKAYKDSLNIFDYEEEEKSSSFSFEKSFYKQVVFKRRSIREFSKQAISKVEFDSIMDILNQAISSDCNEKLDIYCVINRVKDMPLGVIKNGKYIKEGDFIKKAGYLCLEQDLGSSSAVTFFILSNSKNYQAMYQKAGIIGQRLYLSSNYLGIECSGIGAYYDDEVCEFLGVYSQVLYALAIGR